jgi:Phosphoribosyl transferase (PRTase)/PELOTA RNA binding domain
VSVQALSDVPQPLVGPAFGSYAPDEVRWLLKDISSVTLEETAERREGPIQRGERHYSETLPVEYRPTKEYRRLFDRHVVSAAGRVAESVGLVAELLLRERGPDLVLASLARAGTPIGVLLRRWANDVHGLDWPHFTLSIIRGRGIDLNALRWLAYKYDPPAVAFIDGWTGKGAIAAELFRAVTHANASLELSSGHGFDPSLAVLADPGCCVRTFGTRDDYLIPSACLNSTVSGLVSRTVLNEGLIGPNDFHGAKFYRHLAGDDVSAAFIERTSTQFSFVRTAVARKLGELEPDQRLPTQRGRSAIARICERFDLPSEHLAKPGIGETIRVLLRRIPWRILVNPERQGDLAPVRLLAAERGVPVRATYGLPYAAVGLIRPSDR